jgi:hypothetical protein
MFSGFQCGDGLGGMIGDGRVDVHGMHVRILSTGSKLEDLAQVRRDFARDFTALTSSTYWF